MMELIPIIDSTGINIQDIMLQTPSEIVSLLDPEGTMHPTFYIYDSYSVNLARIRRQKRELEQQIRQQNDEINIMELKRMRLDIVVQEEEEELDIRKSLTYMISEHISILENNIKAIGRLDFLLGKARLAIKYDGVKPDISNGMDILMDGMFNPEIREFLKDQARAGSQLRRRAAAVRSRGRA
jgi:dsDNA-specific endonuclease/ATPase MutS2